MNIIAIALQCSVDIFGMATARSDEAGTCIAVKDVWRYFERTMNGRNYCCTTATCMAGVLEIVKLENWKIEKLGHSES